MSYLSFSRAFFLLGTAALLAACASGPRIITNADPMANFAQYRTFGFMQPLGTDSASGRTLTSQHLIASVTDELSMRGLRQTNDNPDLLVNFFVSTREVVTSSPSTGASMHWRRGRYGTWGGYSMSVGTPTVTQQTHGTLAVDLVDAERGQLVWEGAATKRVTNNTRQNLEESLSNAIRDLFVELPF